MITTILTDEQQHFLLDILSHDADMIASLIDGAGDLHHAGTMPDISEYASATSTALIGDADSPNVPRDGRHPAAFVGTRESHAGEFAIWCDRSLDEGPNVLTAKCLDPNAAFMGFIYDAEAKFVEVPARLANAIADCIDVATDDEDAADTIGIDHTDLDDIQSFVEALRRIGTVPSTRATRTVLMHLNVEVPATVAATTAIDTVESALNTLDGNSDGLVINVMLAEEVS